MRGPDVRQRWAVDAVRERPQIISKCRNAAMMGSRLAGGQGTARRLPLRLGASRTGSPASSLQWAIQHVFGTNPCLAFTQSWICWYVAMNSTLKSIDSE